MKNKFFVAQTSVNDCGFACLAMIFNLHQIRYNLDDLRMELNIKQKGTSAYEIVKTASRYGINAQGYKNYDINKGDFPLIALQVNENNLQHFVVVLKIIKNEILIADPSLGVIRKEKEDFNKKYMGICITFNKKESLFKIFVKYKKNIISLVLLSIVISFLSILFSYSLSLTIKILESGANNFNVFIVLIFFLLIGITKEYFVLIKYRLSFKFQLLIDKVITLPIIKKLLNLPYAFYYQNGAGELISKINDLSHIKDMIFQAAEVLFVNLFLIFTISIVLLIIDFKLFMLNIIIILILYNINKRFLNKHFYKTYDLQVKNECLNNNMNSIFNNILAVKNLVKEEYLFSKIKNNYDEVIIEHKNLTIPYQNKEFFVSVVIVFINIILFYIMLTNQYSTSVTLFIFSLENLIISSLTQVYKLQPLYFNYKSCYMRLESLVNQKELLEESSFINIENIQFKNVIYKYEEVLVLKGINFTINKGDWVMVTGKTGSGKSTLFKLLTKQIKGPYEGIYINGNNIENYNDLRKYITYVDQKTKLFNYSLKENILLGKEEYSKASKAALVNDLIKQNNISYDYEIDNINSNLSGGQLQKIIIARTLCNGSDVIIFDETTSQIDIKTERKILNNIKKIYKNKTIILITHRDKNADLFDKKIVFEDGIIKERK